MTDAAPTPAAPAAAAPAAPSGILARAQTKALGPRSREGGEAYMFSIRDEVAELLTGSPFDVDSYLQNAYRDILKSKLLTEAAQKSGPTVLGGVMLGATLQLPIGGPLGQFYLTPRNEGQGQNRRPVCVPMIGYRGFFELGFRSGRIQSFDYLIVREGDRFEQGSNSERGNFYDWDQFEGGEFDEHDADGNVRPLEGVVAIAYPTNGGRPAFKFLSRKAIERRRPKQLTNTPWEGPHREAMYVKTPHRELAKYLQLSIATATAAEADERISQWNRTTSALETLDTAEDQTYVEGAVVDEGGNGPSRGAAGGSQTIPDASGESTPEPSKPAEGHVAVQDTTGIDALDLPAHVRALGRDMTEAEFDRYSAAGGE